MTTYNKGALTGNKASRKLPVRRTMSFAPCRGMRTD